jgi:hypothetical protein
MHVRIYVRKLEATKLSAKGEKTSSKSTGRKRKRAGQPEDQENRAGYQSWNLEHALRT